MSARSSGRSGGTIRLVIENAAAGVTQPNAPAYVQEVAKRRAQF